MGKSSSVAAAGPGRAETPAAAATGASSSATEEEAGAGPGVSKAAATLPIEGYDNLTVPQITARLAGLNAAQLKQLRTYEKRHKARLGVLQRIDAAILRAPR